MGAALGEGFGHFYAARLWNNPPDNDCWFSYTKWALLPACPVSPAGHAVSCLRVGDADNNNPDVEQNAYRLIDSLYPDQTDRDHLRNDRANWYFVKSPSLISCAEASRWRNKYCAPEITVSGVTSDVSEFGNEMDWMQFNWSLTRDVDAWTVSQYFALLRAACGGRLCQWNDALSWHAWKKYVEVRNSPSGDVQNLPEGQWRKLLEQGNQRGVSTDLSWK